MKLHANARTCPKSRRLLVDRIEGGWSVIEAAEAAGITDRTARRWVARWRTEGPQGLLDRSSAPRRIPSKTAPERVWEIIRLRRLRMTAAQISTALGMALSTVSAVLKRVGLGKRSRLEPPEPPNRYERRRPGELIHIDIKKLGRILKPGHRVTGDRHGQSRDTAAAAESGSVRPAGSSCTSRSTITAALPTPRSSQTRRAQPPSRSYVAPLSFSPATASACSE